MRLLLLCAAIAAILILSSVSSPASARGGSQGSSFGRVDPVPSLVRSNKGGERRSNKGGELRGLDRADAAAGNHGDQGRDKAEANQSRNRKKNF
jgi:hypothetical protein